MKHAVSIALFTLALASCAFGQTNTPVTIDPTTYSIPRCTDSSANPIPCPPPREAVAYLGTSYNAAGSPKSTMNLAGFYPVLDGGKLYVGAALDVTFKPNSQPSFAIRPEALPLLYTFQVNKTRVPIYGIVGLGAQIEPTDPVATIQNLRAAVSNVGTNYGLNAALGATTSIHVTRAFYLAPSFRWVGGDGKPAKIVGIGVAWKFAVARR